MRGGAVKGAAVWTATLLSSSVAAHKPEGEVLPGFQPKNCNARLFGEENPRYLEANWAQNAAGTGFLRDALLKPEEKTRKPVATVSGEAATTEAFRGRYPNAVKWSQSPAAQGDFHSEAVYSLLAGPWALSPLDAREAVVRNADPSDLKSGYGQVSTNQSVSCDESTLESSGTLFFHAAGNDWTDKDGSHSLVSNCVSVASADPLGYASHFSSGVGRESRALAAYSDLELKVMDGAGFGGTSAAAPLAGSAALYLLKAAPTLDPTAVARVLELTATLPRKEDAERGRLGSGMVNIPRALVLARFLSSKGSPSDEAQALSREQVAKILADDAKPPYPSFAQLLEGVADCDEYVRRVQAVARAASVEADDRSAGKSVLANFYFAHGLDLSAHRLLRTPRNDAQVVALFRRIRDDAGASVELRSYALFQLAQVGAVSQKELREETKKEEPLTALLAAKALALKGLLTNEDCQRFLGFGRAARTSFEKPESRWTPSAQAAWLSEVNEPVGRECKRFGIDWRD
jgi:hypothetical protein